MNNESNTNERINQFVNSQPIRYSLMKMHLPVLKKEVLEYLAPKPNENFIDCTVGEGGHTLDILGKNGPRGKVLGIDMDPEILKDTRYKIQDTKYKNRVLLVYDNFANLKKIVNHYRFKSVSGILFDLGMSSWHLERAGRGFSFLKDEPLDMRYAPNDLEPSISNSPNLAAADIINSFNAEELAKIFWEYGQERFSRQIAKKIIETRKIKPIKTTFQLVEIIKNATPGWYHHKKIHPATKTFQALRIAVNNELENLKKALLETIEILMPGGRLVVISFQSLEDRIVKNFYNERKAQYTGHPAHYKDKSKERLFKILTKKPILTTKEEILENPRSRSAKLRAAQFLRSN